MSENKDKKPLGKNGVDMGERGVYDKRNSLNDLTGKEWIFFTNSVWITGFSPTAKENVGIKIRKIHPSPKPPVLMRDIIKFFTKTNGRILLRQDRAICRGRAVFRTRVPTGSASRWGRFPGVCQHTDSVGQCVSHERPNGTGPCMLVGGGSPLPGQRPNDTDWKSGGKWKP